MYTVTDDVSPTDDTVHNGWIQANPFLGKKDCWDISTGSRRFVLWLDGRNKSSLADGQTLLEQLLYKSNIFERYKLRPCLRFKVLAGTLRTATEAEWSCEDEKVLLLRVPDSQNRLVLRPGLTPGVTEHYILLSTQNGDLQSARLFWCVNPEPPNVREPFYVVTEQQADEWGLLQSDPEYGKLLAEHASDTYVSVYISRFAAECSEFLSKCNDWSALEQQKLVRLHPDLQQIIRQFIIQTLEEGKLGHAWRHPSNQSLIEKLRPEWVAKVRQRVAIGRRKDAFKEILGQLRIRAIDVEIRDDQISEIGITDGSDKGGIQWTSESKGDAQSFLLRALSDPEIGCLVGHNIARWDLPRLRAELGENGAHLLDRPFLDTLLIEAIVRPRYSYSLELGGDHHALADARKTLELFESQTYRLARLPSAVLRAWAAMASPSLRSYLEKIAEHRDHLSGVPDDDVQTSGQRKNAPRFLHQLRDRLKRLPSASRTLVVVPRRLLSAVLTLETPPDTLILDCGASKPASRGIVTPYVEMPTPNHTKKLQERGTQPEGLGIDLLVYVAAFVHASREVGQLPHTAAMADWARQELIAEDILPFVASNLFAQPASLPDLSPHALTIVPLDNIARTEFVNHLCRYKYDALILFAPELDAASLVNEEALSISVPHAWRIKGTTDGWILGVDADDAQAILGSGGHIPPGWRGWVKDSGLDSATLYTIPQDIYSYIEGLGLAHRHEHVTIYPRSSKKTTIVVAAEKDDKQKQAEANPTAMLSPTSRYRADYLGQVAARVVPHAKNKRVVLVLNNNAKEIAALEDSLLEELHIPRGTKLRRLQKLAACKHGLVICQPDDLLDWVSTAEANGIRLPFDKLEVVLAAWPLDDPVAIPPFSLRELRILRATRTQPNPDAQESDDTSPNEIEDTEVAAEDASATHDLDIDDDEDDQTPDYPKQEVLPTVADILFERLCSYPGLLSTMMLAISGLTKAPPLVLDPRLQVTKSTKESAPFILKQESVDFDPSLAESIASRLKQKGLSAAPKNSRQRLSDSQRNEIARNLFPSIEQLHDWQHRDLEVIMAPEQGTDPLAITASTGGGKSLVYQFPALVDALTYARRLTLVVSPLKALMREQCQKLWEAGFVFMVDRLSGDMTQSEIQDTCRRVADGEICLLFVAPERFRSRRFQAVLKERMDRDGRLQYWVFDEAHCISLWGHSFRPDYFYAAKRACDLRSRYTDDGITPVLLFTATLPPQIHQDLNSLFFAHEATAEATN